MKMLLRLAILGALIGAGFLSCHTSATAAPPSCSMNQSTLPDLIANYDPPLATASSTISIPAGTLTYTCSGLGTGSAAHVYIELNGAASGSFVTPSLAMSGPPAFTLTYIPCLPNTGTCNGTASLWQNTITPTTTAFKVTNAVNGTNSVPAFSIFIGKQDAYVGTTAQYLGSLYFSFVCGEGGTQAAC